MLQFSIARLFFAFLFSTLPVVNSFTAPVRYIIPRTAIHMSSSSSVTSNGFFDLPEDGMFGDGGKTSAFSHDLSLQSHEGPRFAEGDELHRLRQVVLSMRQALHEARKEGNTFREKKLTRAILSAQQRDAEFIYQVTLERMEAAYHAGFPEEAETYRLEAERARSALPQFQLEGLWVGKYGETFQMINVTYSGDVLTAHKVTGDKHVPKGEITFQVDLSPSSTNNLEPIELGYDAEAQWSSKYLQRHAGKGQVAADGFVNHQWLDGQLILVNQYFSFAWLPTGHQVFFGRPSPELTLKLMRESGAHKQLFSNENYNGEMTELSARQHLMRCMEETELLNDEMEVSDSIFGSHEQEFYFHEEGCFE